VGIACSIGTKTRAFSQRRTFWARMIKRTLSFTFEKGCSLGGESLGEDDSDECQFRKLR
jgi:hypothetical protein